VSSLSASWRIIKKIVLKKETEIEGQRGREAERQRGREAERQRGREAERQRDRETERHKERERGEAERQIKQSLY
jgi:hypothetical protein